MTEDSRHVYYDFMRTNWASYTKLDLSTSILWYGLYLYQTLFESPVWCSQTAQHTNLHLIDLTPSPYPQTSISSAMHAQMKKRCNTEDLKTWIEKWQLKDI